MSERLRILLVEDDEDDYVLIRELLSDALPGGCVVHRSQDWDDGLQQMRSEESDVYLFDYFLGTHTGIDLLAEATALRPLTPVILLTGAGSEELAVAAMRAGAADYIAKSTLSVDALRRTIKNAVEKYRLQAAIEEQQRLLGLSNEELVRRNEEIRSFYHTVSHELKTPLTAAREFVSIVLEGYAGTLADQQREYLQIVKESCDQMGYLMNDLLDAARLETGKLQLAVEQVCLGAVMTKAVQSVRLTAEERGIDLQVAVPADLPAACVDQQRILQVLRNLLINALKFTPPAGKVCLNATLAAEGERAMVVSVSDTGCGIEADELPRVFDRLYQANTDDGAVRGGLGMGLNISREIVHLHGGELTAQSTPGIGSVFSFTLPLDNTENPTQSPAEENQA